MVHAQIESIENILFPKVIFSLTVISILLYSNNYSIFREVSLRRFVMRRSMRVGFVLLLLVGVLGVLQPAFGQEVTAAIVGTITDPSGAPINGASITVTDTERGTVLTARTTDAGSYTVLRVPIGTYTLKVSAPGFQTS